jgi:hypothetical protein
MCFYSFHAGSYVSPSTRDVVLNGGRTSARRRDVDPINHSENRQLPIFSCYIELS